MAPTFLFSAMAFLAAILLLLSSLAATAGAVYAYESGNYNNYVQIRSAHQYLTIAAVLGWASLVVLVTVLIVGYYAGGFTTEEVSNAILDKNNLTPDDLVALYRGDQKLSSVGPMQIILLTVLVIIVIITFIIGVLSTIAAVQLGGVPVNDSNVSSAYGASIVAAVAGVGGIILMIVAIVAYIAIRAARAEQLAKIESRELEAEQKLGITEGQLVNLAAQTSSAGTTQIVVAPTVTPTPTNTPITPITGISTVRTM